MFRKYQAVFRSRWRALIWAGGMLMTAYCSIPSAHQTDSQKASRTSTATRAAVADSHALLGLFGHGNAHHASKPAANPWETAKSGPVN